MADPGVRRPILGRASAGAVRSELARGAIVGVVGMRERIARSGLTFAFLGDKKYMKDLDLIQKYN